MEPLALALARLDLLDNARSALPDAPVVPPPVRRQPAMAARRRAAAALDRAARAIAPPSRSCAS
jgi:hypothetical protein